jgi:hypothetical protein
MPWLPRYGRQRILPRPLAEAIRRDPSLSVVDPGGFEGTLGRLLTAACEGLSA